MHIAASSELFRVRFEVCFVVCSINLFSKSQITITKPENQYSRKMDEKNPTTTHMHVCPCVSFNVLSHFTTTKKKDRVDRQKLCIYSKANINGEHKQPKKNVCETKTIQCVVERNEIRLYDSNGLYRLNWIRHKMCRTTNVWALCL